MDRRISKSVANRQTNANFVVSSIRLHGLAFVAELGRRLFPLGVPADVNLTKVLEALASALEGDTSALAQADADLIVELSDDQPKRDTRDVAAAALRTRLISAAALLNGAYGFDLATTYNLGGPTPVAPDLLLKRAETAAQALRAKPITASPQEGNPAIDPAALAASIEARANDLSNAVAGVLTEAREYQLALNTRDRAFETWSRTYRGAATVAAGLFTLVDQDALAEVVRPTIKRVTGEEVVEEPPIDAPPPAPGATPPAAGATPPAAGATPSTPGATPPATGGDPPVGFAPISPEELAALTGGGTGHAQPSQPGSSGTKPKTTKRKLKKLTIPS